MNHETLLFSAAAGLIGIVLAYWHLSSQSKLDLQYLFIDTETKMFSIFKFGQMVALFVSTWVLIRETNHDRLSDWLFGGYMLIWTSANIANRVITKNAFNADPAAK